METTRQQKIAKQLQRDLSEMFARELTEIVRGAMVTVMEVRMSPDGEYARVWLSVFPFERAQAVMAAVEAGKGQIRGALGARIRKQVRVVPELTFVLDDSFEYIEKIDNLLK